ncbi:hypothetical protein VIGAN_08022700, partial [Vigna angularis var. angularis]
GHSGKTVTFYQTPSLQPRHVSPIIFSSTSPRQPYHLPPTETLTLAAIVVPLPPLPPMPQVVATARTSSPSFLAGASTNHHGASTKTAATFHSRNPIAPSSRIITSRSSTIERRTTVSSSSSTILHPCNLHLSEFPILNQHPPP